MKGRDTKGADLSLSTGAMNRPYGLNYKRRSPLRGAARSQCRKACSLKSSSFGRDPVRRLVLGALVLAALVSAGAARGEVRLGMIQAKPRSGIDIEMVGFFNELPKSGYAPIKITIRNDTGRTHTWQFSFRSEIFHRGQASVRYEWAARVEGGKQRAYEVLVPLVTSPERSYSSLTVLVRGYGMEQGHGQYPVATRYSGHSHVPFALMSSTLGTASWSELENELKKRRSELSGSLFNVSPAWVPSDWRAFAGVASVWLADTDWDRLPAAVRVALLQWVAQGGQIFYCAPGMTAARMDRAGLPGDGRERIHGLGRITAFEWKGRDMPVQGVADTLRRKAVANPSDDLLTGYQHGWAPRIALGETTVNALAIILAVIAFAVVVGPINLIFFASPRRRHRLFWTTPLISLGAAIVMGIIILLHDGVGGKGQRVALALLLPEQREMVLVQEQAALTGVLLSPAFPLDEDVYPADIRLTKPSQGGSVDLRLGPGSAGGSWFSSRTVQGQCLAAVRPSRARVEVIPAAAGADPSASPVLLSTVEDRLRDVFYVDPAGRYWRAPLLKVGTRTPLVRSSAEEFNREWWKPHILADGLRARGRILNVAACRSYIYALADDPPTERFIATHPAIDWESKLVYMGPCLPAGKARP